MNQRRQPTSGPRRDHRRRGGFTLIEIVVVIGIIMLLLGIGLISYRAVDAAASRKMTATNLAIGEAMLAEYSNNTAGALDNLPGARTTDSAFSGGDVNTGGNGRGGVISAVLPAMTELLKLDKNQKVVAQLPTKALVSGQSNPPLLADAWGNPIALVSPKGITTTVGGASRTIQAPSGRPFWASAGPDGDFGAGDDNVYSFEK